MRVANRDRDRAPGERDGNRHVAVGACGSGPELTAIVGAPAVQRPALEKGARDVAARRHLHQVAHLSEAEVVRMILQARERRARLSAVVGAPALDVARAAAARRADATRVRRSHGHALERVTHEDSAVEQDPTVRGLRREISAPAHQGLIEQCAAPAHRTHRSRRHRETGHVKVHQGRLIGLCVLLAHDAGSAWNVAPAEQVVVGGDRARVAKSQGQGAGEFLRGRRALRAASAHLERSRRHDDGLGIAPQLAVAVRAPAANGPVLGAARPTADHGAGVRRSDRDRDGLRDVA